MQDRADVIWEGITRSIFWRVAMLGWMILPDGNETKQQTKSQCFCPLRMKIFGLATGRKHPASNPIRNDLQEWKLPRRINTARDVRITNSRQFFTIYKLPSLLGQVEVKLESFGKQSRNDWLFCLWIITASGWDDGPNWVLVLDR